MRQPFNCFAVRFLTAVLLGLLLIALHGRVSGGFFTIFVPRFASPWELGKLIYWPLLGAGLLTGRTKVARWRPGREVPCLVLAPMALFLLYWCLSLLDLSSGIYVLVWMLVLAAGLLTALLGSAETRPSAVWTVLAVTLGAVYVIFSFMPPMWGPFLDPTDVAALATIPY